MASIRSIFSSGNRVKVKSNLGGRLVDILIDTGAACSCTDIPLPLTNETIQIKGIGDTLMTATLTKPVRLDLGSVVLTAPFWYLPENSEGTVLGMDIMKKHGLVVDCLEKQIEVVPEKTTQNKPLRNFASNMSISSPEPIRQPVTKDTDTWANHEHDCDLTDFKLTTEGNLPPQVLTEDWGKDNTKLASPQRINSFERETSNHLHELIPHSDILVWSDGNQIMFPDPEGHVCTVPALDLPSPPNNRTNVADGFHWPTHQCQKGGKKWVDANSTCKNYGTGLREPNHPSVLSTLLNSIRPKQSSRALSIGIPWTPDVSKLFRRVCTQPGPFPHGCMRDEYGNVLRGHLHPTSHFFQNDHKHGPPD